MAQLQKALRLNPADPLDFDAWVGLTVAFIELKRDAEGLEAARQAVRRGPNFTSSWGVLAASLALSGQTVEARKARDEFVRLKPNSLRLGTLAQSPFIAFERSRYREGLRLAGLVQ